MAILIFTDLTPDVPVNYILDGIPGTVTPTQIAPISSNTLEPQLFKLGTGTQTIVTAYAFTGSALVYSLVTPSTGVTVDDGTGVVSINTEATGPLSAETITIRATNSGGFADQTFDLTVTTAALTNILANGEFDTDTLWTFQGGWGISGGKLTYSGDGSAISRSYQRAVNMTTTPTVLGVYDVEIKVDVLTGRSVNVGFNAGLNYNTSAITAPGTYNTTLNWTGGTFNELRVNGDYLKTLEIDYIRIIKQ